ncbi:hypothetical protein YC2023_096223 [Brassica napus]
MRFCVGLGYREQVEAMTTIQTGPKTQKPSPSTLKQPSSSIKRWGRRHPFVRYGLPMISLTVFGPINEVKFS